MRIDPFTGMPYDDPLEDKPRRVDPFTGVPYDDPFAVNQDVKPVVQENIRRGSIRGDIANILVGGAPRSRVPFSQAVERSGGLLGYIKDFGPGFRSDAAGILHGITAAAGLLVNAGITIPTGLLSKYVAPTLNYPRNYSAERYVENKGENASEFIAATVRALADEVRSFQEDPYGYMQEHPLQTALDVGGAMSIGGKGASKLARTLGHQARAGSKMAEAAARTASAAEFARKVTPARGVVGLGQLAARAARQIPEVETFAVTHAMKRDVDRFYTDNLTVRRVLSEGAVRDAAAIFGELSAEDKLAFIPVISGRQNPVRLSDKALEAIRVWQNTSAGDEWTQSVILRLNLLGPDEIENAFRVESAAWREMQEAAAYTRGSERIVPTVEEMLHNLGMTTDEVLAKSYRERNWPIPESEIPRFRTAPSGRGMSVGTEAVEVATERILREADVEFRDLTAPRGPRDRRIRREDVLPTVTPGRVSIPGRMPDPWIDTPGRIPEPGRTRVERVRYAEVIPAHTETRLGEVRWAGSYKDYPLDGSLPDIKPPDVTIIKPTYFPIVMELGIQKGGLFHLFKRMRAPRAEALAKATEEGLGQPLPRRSMAEGIASQIEDISTSELVLAQQEKRAAELLESRRTGTVRAMTTPGAVGAVSPSGSYAEPGFLMERSGRGALSPLRVQDSQIVAAHHFTEQARLMSNAHLVNQIEKHWAFKIGPLAEGGFRVTTPTGHDYFDKVFASVDDAKKALKISGIEWQGQRYEASLFLPKYYELEAVMTDRAMSAIRIGLLKGKTLTGSITDALKTVSSPEIARLRDEASKGVVYAIPRPVADKIRRIAKVEESGRDPGTFGLILDDTNVITKHMWLATPRFIINNLAGGLTISVLAGTTPRSLYQAFLPKYKKLLDDIGEIRFSQAARELTDDSYDGMSTKATGNLSSDLANTLRQDAVLSTMGSKMEAFGNSVNRLILAPIHKLGAQTDEYFRRAAAIQKAKNLIPSDQLADAVRLKQIGIDGSILDEVMTATQRRLHQVRTNPEMLNEVIKHVNYWFFDYFGLPAYQRVYFRRAVPFWNWMKNITLLQLKLPVDHPGRTMLATHTAQVMSDVTEQEKLPLWYRGTVKADFAEGQRLRTTGMNVFGDTVLGPLSGERAPSVTWNAAIDLGLYLTGMDDAITPQARNIVETWNRKYRYDRYRGDYIVSETLNDLPPISDYFYKLIPHVNVLSESVRNTLSYMPDSAAKEWSERLVGKPQTEGTQTLAGYRYPPLKWRRTLGFFGLNLGPDVGPHSEELQRIGEKRALELIERERMRRLMGGQTEEVAPFEPR